MIDGLADHQLAAWVEGTRSEPAAYPPDLTVLRAPRSRAPGPSVSLVDDIEIPSWPSVGARLYRPDPSPVPIVVYAHGGCFAYGSLDSHDRTCRRLALSARCAVLAVDYRLAPEYPAPSAIDDVANAAAWACTHPPCLGPLVDTPALAGDSSGGALAVLAALRLTSIGKRPSALLLAYPNADLALSRPSVLAKGTGWGLDSRALGWFIEQWVPALDHPALSAFSTLHADLAGLPPTLVGIAEHDPLHDEGAALVERLIEHGVDAHCVDHPGMVHGFIGLDDVSPAAERAGTDLMRRFGTLLPRKWTANRRRRRQYDRLARPPR
jgi:acetyl esterase